MPVRKGDRVKVEYRGTFADGTVFESTEDDGEPLEFVVGEGEVIDGFERAVLGMEVGEEREVVLGPLEAYGERDPDLVREIPREGLPPGDVGPGTMYLIESPKGGKMLATVMDVRDDTVVLDLNHPLAGKDLTFVIRVVDVQPVVDGEGPEAGDDR